MLHREAVCLPILQKSHHLQSICTVCCDWKWRLFFFYGWWWRWGGYISVCFPYFVRLIFMGSFVSGCFFVRNCPLAWESCMRGGWAGRFWAEGPQPQAPWTWRAVWILPTGCSSHCVIGRIMFRDSLSFAPPYVLLEQFGAFYHPENEAGSASGRVTPPTPPPPPASPVVQMSLWHCHRSEARVHRASSSSPIPEVWVKASNMPEPIQGLACMWPSGLFTRVKFGNRSLKETNANI